MFNIFIVDDNEFFLKKMLLATDDFFENRKEENINYIFTEYNEEFYDYVKKNLDNKIYFLDIETPNGNGLDVFKYIRMYDSKSRIVFITSHEEMSLEILKITKNLTGFISKQDENFDEQFTDILKYIVSTTDDKGYLSFVYNNIRYNLSFNRINFIETLRRKTILHTNDELEDIFFAESLDSLQKRLDNRFERIHKSCIANMDNAKIIRKHGKKCVIFENGDITYLISRDYKIKDKV